MDGQGPGWLTHVLYLLGSKRENERHKEVENQLPEKKKINLYISSHHLRSKVFLSAPINI